MNDDNTTRIEQMLREAGPVLKEADQPVEVPPHVLARLRAVREMNFPTRRELTAKQLGPLLLSVLAKGELDGFDIISRLAKSNIQIKGGEAVAYGALSELVSANLVLVDLEERGGQMRKLYRLTDDGRAWLKTVEAPELNTLASAVWAAG